MANQGFRQIFSWCETPPGSTKEVECACVPIHNASKLQGLPIDPDLDTTCVQGDVLVWDGTEWVCDGPINLTGVTGPTGPTGPTGTVGAGVPVSFVVTGPTGGFFTGVINNSKQYDKIVIIQIEATLNLNLIANGQNFVGMFNPTQRPAIASGPVSVYISGNTPFFGFEASISSLTGDLFIKPGVLVPAGSFIEIGGAYTSV
jgi:hypothetical protein